MIDKTHLIKILSDRLFIAKKEFERTKNKEWLGRIQQIKEIIQLVESL